MPDKDKDIMKIIEFLTPRGFTCYYYTRYPQKDSYTVKCTSYEADIVLKTNPRYTSIEIKTPIDISLKLLSTRVRKRFPQYTVFVRKTPTFEVEIEEMKKEDLHTLIKEIADIFEFD